MNNYAKALVLSLFLVSLLPIASAKQSIIIDSQEYQQSWSHDFGELYISTSPKFIGDTVIVRTSSSSTSQGVPGVYSFDLDGELNWQHLNPNSLMQDMSPLNFILAGQSNCGSWDDSIIIGWSDGLIQSLDFVTGEVNWQHQTEVNGWGITGSLAITDGKVTVPTRQGVEQYCLNGEKLFSATTSFGWRNGVTHISGEYWVGDEQGALWRIDNLGNPKSFPIGPGKIRHAPIATSSSNLAIHLQTDTGSELYIFDTIDLTVTKIHDLGYSPGIPIMVETYLVLSDFSGLSLFDCSEQCDYVNTVDFSANGEISHIFEEYISANHNSITGGHGIFQINNGELGIQSRVFFGDDWYGTAALQSTSINGQEYLAVANDNAILKIYINGSPISNDDTTASDNLTNLEQLFLLIFLVLIFSICIQLLIDKFHSAFKLSLVFLLMVSYMAFDDVIVYWADLTSEEPKDSVELWDETWPDEWLGTQIVIFEFKDSTIETGGFTNYDDVLELTIASCLENNLDLEILSTSLGKYIVAINGSYGEGWEYFVNDSPGQISAEYQSINSDSIIVWKEL